MMDTDEILRTALPTEMTCKPRWVCYQLRPRGNGKQGKVPVSLTTGRAINHRDTRHHLAFAVALAGLSRPGIDGLGYVMDAGEVLVDLDDCVVAGKLTPMAQTIVGSAMTYAEISVSGTGCKLVLAGHKPGEACRSGGVEMYGPGFFAALTGRRLTEYGLQARQAWLDDLYARYMTDPSCKPAQCAVGPPLQLADEEILRRARRARNSAKFCRLYDCGDTGGYNSQSEADYALVRLLGFWTQQADQVDRLFQHSALMTPKWLRPLGDSTYGRRTIERALAAGGPVYRPR